MAAYQPNRGLGGLLAIVLVLLSAGMSTGAGLAINEFMASNVLAWANPEDAYEDWIEIYNPYSTPVDLAGYYLTDNPEGTTPWRIPSGQPARTVIPARSFRLLYADALPEMGADHLGFKLDKDHEHIALLDPDGQTLVDSLSYTSQFRDISYSRYPDGGSAWFYTSNITPGAANKPGYAAWAAPPTIAPAAGFYADHIEITLQPARTGDRIHYTLDGSEPSERSPLYAQPFAVTRSAILRARTINPGQLPSTIASRAFFIGKEHALPVLALMTDPANLYDPATGIYVNDFDGRAWERFAELEFFQEKALQFHQACGIRIQGNTGPKDYQKKSFRTYFRSGYGEAALDYPLYQQDSVRTFTRLVLRSGYDDSMEPSSDGKNAGGTLLRDPLVTELWRRSGGLTPASRFAVLYLNQSFHGIYDLKQSIDETFVMDHLGYSDLDLMRTRWDSTELVYGSREEWKKLVAFFENNSFSSDASVTAAARYLDLDEYITLQALMHGTQYKSWGYGVFMFRNKVPSARWRWTIWDADRAWNELTWNGFTSQYGALSIELDNLITKKLLQNPAFKVRYISRLCDLFNTVFLPATVTGIIDSLAAGIAADIPAEVAKWDNTAAQWQENVAAMKEFAQLRPAIVRQQVQEYFKLAGPADLSVAIAAGRGRIRVNTIIADSSPWSGRYFQNIPVTITALPDPGYRFAGWSDPALQQEATITLKMAGDVSVAARFAPVNAVNAELIAPSLLPAGQSLPVVVRIRDANWAIDPVEQTPIAIGCSGARSDTTIQIKRGAGTAWLPVNSSAEFLLSAGNSRVPETQKRVQISVAPLQRYSGTLAAGETVWDASAIRLVTGDLTIPAGSRLVVKPGTWVVVQKYRNFYIQGEMTVEGNANDPVVITSERREESWGGMEFTRGKARFAWCFILNGGGDASKGNPTSDGWHTGHQHLFFGKDKTEFTFDNCFFLYSPGKVFGAQESKVSVTNSVTAFVWHGGEFHHTLLSYRESHLLNLPNDDHIYTEDIDTDGFHIDYVHPDYPQYSVIDHCWFVTGKDDAIDHHAARLRVSNCWLEDFIHEGVAASGGDTVRIFNTLALNNDQGFEAGWTDSGVSRGPVVLIDHCAAIGNNVGLRIGDSYTWTYKDFMRVTNTVLYNNKDNIWNYLLSTKAPLAGALEISSSMTNDAEYDRSPGCITGIPQFDALYYLLPGSPGSGMGSGGTMMGRADSTVLTIGAVAISEIMHKTPADRDANDWIELYNPNSQPQDLSGWKLSDDNAGHTFRIPQGTVIPAHGYRVLCADTAAFRKNYPGVSPYCGNISFGFGSADQVRLYTAWGGRVDSVAYTSSDPWPGQTDGEGYSLELIDPAASHLQAANWARSAAYGGSPGRANRTTGIGTTPEPAMPLQLALRQNYPNPFNAVTQIVYTIPQPGRVDLAVYNLRGQQVREVVRQVIPQAGEYRAVLQAGDLASGLYFYRLEFSGSAGMRETLTRKLVLVK
ncbi:MAG TPA: CotH kinase family protein [bacterium]|nr:CotH kinase family protein [bacterium]